jgi:hypothetical protein
MFPLLQNKESMQNLAHYTYVITVQGFNFATFFLTENALVQNRTVHFTRMFLCE